MVLLRVNISPGRVARTPEPRKSGSAVSDWICSRVHCHHLLGILVVHGRLARLGDDQQRLVVLAEESVPDPPGEVETGELREALAIARRHFHEAQRIGDKVISSQSGKRRDQFGGGAANGLMNLLADRAARLRSSVCSGRTKDGKFQVKSRTMLSSSSSCKPQRACLNSPLAEHVGGETVGHFLHLAGGVRSALRGLDQHEELVAIAQFFADLARGLPLRVAAPNRSVRSVPVRRLWMLA